MPISLVAELPLVLLVNSHLAAQRTRRSSSRSRKSKPGELTYGSAGNGSSTHLAASLFENATGTKLVHVPYKGGGPAMQDLMGGVVNLTFLTVLESGSAIKSGKVRPIAVTSLKRSPCDAAAYPTLGGKRRARLFFHLVDRSCSRRRRTPKAIVDKIGKDIQEIVASPDVNERFIQQGATPVGRHARAVSLADRQRAGALPQDHHREEHLGHGVRTRT